MENITFCAVIQFTFPAGTYSINDFNTKYSEAVLQKKTENSLE